MFDFLKSITCHNCDSTAFDPASLPNVILFVGEILLSSKQCKVICPITDLNNIKNHPFKSGQLLYYTKNLVKNFPTINGTCALFEYHTSNKNLDGNVHFSKTDGFNIRVVNPNYLGLARIISPFDEGLDEKGVKLKKCIITKILVNGKENNKLTVGSKMTYQQIYQEESKSGNIFASNIKTNKNHSTKSQTQKIKAAAGGAVGSSGGDAGYGGGEIGLGPGTSTSTIPTTGDGDGNGNGQIGSQDVNENNDEEQNEETTPLIPMSLESYQYVWLHAEELDKNDIVLYTGDENDSSKPLEIVKILENELEQVNWHDKHTSLMYRKPEAFVWGKSIDVDGYDFVKVTDTIITENHRLRLPNMRIDSLIPLMSHKTLFGETPQLFEDNEYLYVFTEQNLLAPVDFQNQQEIDSHSTLGKNWKERAHKSYKLFKKGVVKSIEYFKLNILCESVESGEQKIVNMLEMTTEVEVGDYITIDSYDEIKSIIPKDLYNNKDKNLYEQNEKGKFYKIIDIVPFCVSTIDKTLLPEYKTDVIYEIIQHLDIIHKVNDEVLILRPNVSSFSTPPYVVADTSESEHIDFLVKLSHVFTAKIIKVVESNKYNVVITGCHARPRNSFCLTHVKSNNLLDNIILDEPNIFSTFSEDIDINNNNNNENENDDDDLDKSEEAKGYFSLLGHMKLEQSKIVSTFDEASAESSLGKGPFFVANKHAPIYKLKITEQNTNTSYTVITTNVELNIGDETDFYFRIADSPARSFGFIPDDIL